MMPFVARSNADKKCFQAFCKICTILMTVSKFNEGNNRAFWVVCDIQPEWPDMHGWNQFLFGASYWENWWFQRIGFFQINL